MYDNSLAALNSEVGTMLTERLGARGRTLEEKAASVGRNMPRAIKDHVAYLIEAEARPQTECFAAGVQFARTEGIVPAPEPTHALAATVDEALRCKETGEDKVILTAMCGHGMLDMAAYDAYFAGELVDHEYPDEAIQDALTRLPQMDL